MSYLQEVAKRREAITRHYERGGFPDTCPRHLCETCADAGWVYDHRPIWNQADEFGGYLEADVVEVPCPECPLGEHEREKAAMESESSAA